MFSGTFARITPDKPAAVLADSGQSLTYRQLADNSARLARYLRTRIARFKVPRRFAFVERLPRTATGKPAKHRLVHKQPDEIDRYVEFIVRGARARSADASIPAG